MNNSDGSRLGWSTEDLFSALKHLEWRIADHERREREDSSTIIKLREEITQLRNSPVIQSEVAQAYQRGYAHAQRDQLAWLNNAVRKLATEISNDVVEEN